MSECAHLASLCKALQSGNFKEGNDWEHDSCQCIDWQPVLLRKHKGVSQCMQQMCGIVMNIMMLICCTTMKALHLPECRHPFEKSV